MFVAIKRPEQSESVLRNFYVLHQVLNWCMSELGFTGVCPIEKIEYELDEDDNAIVAYVTVPDKSAANRLVEKLLHPVRYLAGVFNVFIGYDKKCLAPAKIGITWKDEDGEMVVEIAGEETLADDGEEEEMPESQVIVSEDVP